jgi:hypothetical protein
MHYFNATDRPILREFWLNLYFIEVDRVTEEPGGLTAMGGFEWNRSPIPPRSHDVYPFRCPITGSGRIITLLGHTHSHALRLTAWLRRSSGERLHVFEQYDYQSPQIFYYDTVTENPPFSSDAPGAHTGVLEVQDGDVLEWECEVNNDGPDPLYYMNDVVRGEMCNVFGDTVGGATATCLL